jgi:hypothetical protein
MMQYSTVQYAALDRPEDVSTSEGASSRVVLRMSFLTSQPLALESRSRPQARDCYDSYGGSLRRVRYR